MNQNSLNLLVLFVGNLLSAEALTLRSNVLKVIQLLWKYIADHQKNQVLHVMFIFMPPSPLHWRRGILLWTCRSVGMPVGMLLCQSVCGSVSYTLLCRLRSIAAHRDHFVRHRSVCLSGSYAFLVVTHSYVSQATHAFLGMLPLCCNW